MASITRRGLSLGRAVLASAGLTAGVATSIPGPNPDAELVQLGAVLEAEWARADAFDRAHPDCADEEFEAVMVPARKLVSRIEQLPACTLDGFKVKALAISWCNWGDEIDHDPGAPTDARIAASIVRDLLTGRAA